MAFDWNDEFNDYVEERVKEFPDKKPVVFLKISYSPWRGERDILVFEDAEENIYIEGYTPGSLDSNKVSRPFYTILYEEILKFKKLINNPSLWLEQEDSMDYMMEAGFIVEDGSNQELTVFNGEDHKTYRYSNLEDYKKHLKNYPQAKAALSLMEKIVKAVRKYTGLDITL